MIESLAIFWNMHRLGGFGMKWCNWITDCICSTSYSVLINEWFSDRFFPGRKRIRQADPLSPFLFAVVGNTFSFLISKETDWFRGFKVGKMKL